MTIVLSVDRLVKTFRKPFSGRRVPAVKGISLDVHAGEIFGFLGPNGAGKTTTIKMLTGLIAPTSGSARVFGHETPSPLAMARVGFLPENPYVYPYLTPREFVSLCGRLSGVAGKHLFERVEKVIARVGMAYAIDRPVAALSKGMLQRVGLAAALVHEPELLILDEPMSGLDPVGRKEVRDLIVDEKDRGRTVFFSSHILSDVEMLCDRVCILREGEVVVSGRITDLLKADARRTEVTIVDAAGKRVVSEVEGDEAVRALLAAALGSGGRVESVVPKRETLEEIFVRRAI
jgi:ABC-2 type transport system ATP-binding protein